MVKEVVTASTSRPVLETAGASASGGSVSSEPIQFISVKGKGKGKLGRNPKEAANKQDPGTIGSGMKLPRTVPESGPGRWTNQLQFIKEKVMNALMRQKAVKSFKEPINPHKMGIPNYNDFIDRPMDLTTIRSRLNNRYYQNGADECLQDFQLMFCNCYVYNKPGTFVVHDANELECVLLRKLIEMPEPEENYKPGRGGSSSTSQSISESVDGVDGGGGECSEDQTEDESGAKGRKSLRIMQVKESEVAGHGKGSGGKVLRPPEKKRNDDSSSSSSSSEDEQEEDKSDMPPSTAPPSSSSNDSSENDDDGMEADSSNKEQLKLLRIAKGRRVKYMKLLQRQLNNVNEQIAAVQQEEKEDAERIKKLVRNCSNGRGGEGGKSSKKKFSTFTSSAKRKAPMKKTTQTPVKKKATPSKKITPAVPTTSSTTPAIRVPAASSSKKRPSSAATNDDASDVKETSPTKLPPPKKAKVSTSRRSSVMTPPRRSTSSTPNTASPAKADVNNKGRGRPLGSSKKVKEVATTTKAAETPSTSTAPAATGGSGPRPLTTQQINTLNTQVNMLDDEALLEMLQITSPYATGSGNEDDGFLNLANLPPVCQWQIKKFVEESLEKTASLVAKPTEKLAAGQPPQQSKKKKVEKKELTTLTFHAVSPAPASPPDVTSSSSPQEKDLIFQRTPSTVMDDDDECQPSPPKEELRTVVATATVSDKSEKEKNTPPATKKTLTEVTEELLDYDEEGEELLDLY